MLKKLFGIFSLERRIMEGTSNYLQSNTAALLQRLAILEKDIAAKAQQIDKLSMELNKRVGKIEILFAEEIRIKDYAREEHVKALRLGHNK